MADSKQKILTDTKVKRGEQSKQQVLVDSKVKIHRAHGDVPIIMRRRPTIGNAKPQRFVSWHHHSTFSYLDGYALPEAHVRRISELNMGSMALTEHGNIDSHTQFEKAALKEGVKPIFGCEIYMPTDMHGKTQRKFHLTVIARNAEGYRNLVQLVTVSWKMFYHDPIVTWEMLCKFKRGLIILSGCQGSLLSCSTVGGKGIPEEEASYRRGLAVARKFKSVFGKWYLIEVQAFPELDKTRAFNVLAARIARVIKAKLIATMDCHYTVLEENEVMKILHNLRPGNRQTLEEQARAWGYAAPLCPPPNDKSIYRRLRATGLSKSEAIEAIVTTEELAQECDVTLPKLGMVRFPKEAMEGYDNATDYWRYLLKKGWRYRGIDKLPAADRKRYRDQLLREMKIIEEKDFVHYFLLTQAGVVHVKDLGYPVGPARGSAAASVAAWLLRITEVDPLRPDFGGMLRFERFIDVTREDLPDIDLDFPGRVRPILRAFYIRLLGEGCVNNVGTFTYFRAKNSLDDISRVYHIPRYETEKLKGYLIERTNIDLRSSETIEDTISQFDQAAEIVDRHPDLRRASLLEGGIRGFGVHAAALVLSNGPITSVTSVAEREVPKGSGIKIQAIGLDRNDAGYRGLLKMDYLGLNTMEMLQDCIEHPDVKMTLPELYALPLDDPKVFAGFNANDVTGIFQFDGRATRYVNGAVKPKVFRELMDITSLSRPGALHGGSTTEYIAFKWGKGDKERESLHPALDELTKITHYQIVYQEQILTILREIGNFPWEGVGQVRTIISKKHGEAAFNAKREEFLQGARLLHKRSDYPRMSDEIADIIWKRMITAGQYSFNAAHAASYSLISYYCQFFKQYYPHVFFYASLRAADDNDHDKIRELVRDAEEGREPDRRRVKVNPPSIRLSGATWAARRGRIRAGMRQIPGIGPKSAPMVLAARRAARGRGQPWASWDDLLQVKGIGPKGLEKIKAWTSKSDPFDIYKLDRDIANVKGALVKGELAALPVPTHRCSEIPEEQGDKIPVVWLGAIQKRNFRDLFEYHMSKYGESLDPSSVKDPELREWVVCFGEDGTDRVLIKVDRWRYPRLKGAIAGMDTDKELMLVQGFKPGYASTRQINAKSIWIIEPDQEEQNVK